MYIINLNVGNTCHLGCETKLRVLATRGNSVQLGFEAPKDVHIYRSELIFSPDKRKVQTGKARAIPDIGAHFDASQRLDD